MKPLFMLNGVVVNVFVSPKGVSKKTGEEFGGQDKVQIIGDIPLEDGQTRKEMITLTTNQGEQLQKSINQPVTAPVAFYTAKGGVGFYIPRGSQITVLGQSGAQKTQVQA